MALHHDILINKAVERWKNFKPTTDKPTPSSTLTPYEIAASKGFYGNSEQDVKNFHDVAAVLAGSKIATIVSPEFLGTKLGARLHARLLFAGHTVDATPSGYMVGKLPTNRPIKPPPTAKYAAADNAEIPSHPLFKGFRIEHVLRHLATDRTETTSTVNAIAHGILKNGDVHVLPILADALDDQSHRLGKLYNFRSAEHKILLDHAVGKVIEAVHKRFPAGSSKVNAIHTTWAAIPNVSPEKSPIHILVNENFVPVAKEGLEHLQNESGCSNDDIVDSIQRLRDKHYGPTYYAQELAVHPDNRHNDFVSKAYRYSKNKQPPAIFAGTRLEHVLHHLANDDSGETGTDAKNLATHILATGDHGILPILADALDDTNHRLGNMYDFRKAARGLELDAIVHPAVQAAITWETQGRPASAASVEAHHWLVDNPLYETTAKKELREKIYKLGYTDRDLEGSLARAEIKNLDAFHYNPHNAVEAALDSNSDITADKAIGYHFTDRTSFRNKKLDTVDRLDATRFKFAAIDRTKLPTPEVIHGTKLAYVLHHIAENADNEYSNDAKHIATDILTSGRYDSLPILRDALMDTNSPLVDIYNFDKAGRNLQLDEIIHPELHNRIGWSNWPERVTTDPIYKNNPLSVEARAALLHSTQSEGHSSPYDYLHWAREQANKLGLTEDDLRGSLARASYKHTNLYNAYEGSDNNSDAQEQTALSSDINNDPVHTQTYADREGKEYSPYAASRFKFAAKREWNPKYPDIAVSPEQGLYDTEPQQIQPFEPAPETSHVAGWRLQGGGFIRKFYGPSINAPKGTKFVLALSFKPKKRKGPAHYEYYFTDESDANLYLAMLRQAAHPGKIVRLMEAAKVPYKRKYSRNSKPQRYNAKRGDFIGALRRLRSKQQQSLHDIAKAVYKKLDMGVQSIRDAIHDTPTVSSANTAHSIKYHGDPLKAKVAAAWYGLQSQSPALLVFHVGEGDDAVYKVSTTGSGDKLRDKLDELNIKQRTLLPTTTGWDTIIFSPSDRDRDRVQRLLSATGSSVNKVSGRGEIIGSSSDSSADDKTRRSYRAIISNHERKQQLQ